MIIQSWDTAIKSGSEHDASVCLTFEWTKEPEQHALLDCWCERKEYPELKRALVRLAGDYCPDAILVEDKASGQSLLQDLRRETSLPLIAIMPAGDKVTRFARITPMVEAGLVALPKHALWLAAFEAELLAFPAGGHDDRVDAFSQYLNWVRQKSSDALRIRML